MTKIRLISRNRDNECIQDFIIAVEKSCLLGGKKYVINDNYDFIINVSNKELNKFKNQSEHLTSNCLL